MEAIMPKPEYSRLHVSLVRRWIRALKKVKDLGKDFCPSMEISRRETLSRIMGIGIEDLRPTITTSITTITITTIVAVTTTIVLIIIIRELEDKEDKR